MVTALIVYTAFLTLFIVGGIHYYEAKIKDYNESISDYKRALSIAKNNNAADHATYLQLDNYKLKKEVQRLRSAAIYETKHMRDLSDANDHLQAENKRLRMDNNELLNKAAGYPKEIQYESHVWNNALWQSPVYKDTDKIVEL